jgi:hypothetical protein
MKGRKKKGSNPLLLPKRPRIMNRTKKKKGKRPITPLAFG